MIKSEKVRIYAVRRVPMLLLFLTPPSPARGMKGKCDVDFTRLPPPPSYHQNVNGGGGGGGVNFGVVDNFPYPPFVTHFDLEGKKEKSSRASRLSASGCFGWLDAIGVRGN